MMCDEKVKTVISHTPLRITHPFYYVEMLNTKFSVCGCHFIQWRQSSVSIFSIFLFSRIPPSMYAVYCVCTCVYSGIWITFTTNIHEKKKQIYNKPVVVGLQLFGRPSLIITVVLLCYPKITFLKIKKYARMRSFVWICIFRHRLKRAIDK